MNRQDLLERVVGLVLQAGRAILDVYTSGDLGVTRKDDASPVTRADAEAERIILAGLAEIAPGVPIVAEESVSAGRTPPTAELFFLVDPLDGTKEFISRNGEFTVNVALVEAGAPVLGVVYAPALGRAYAGGSGLGAQCLEIVGHAVASRRPVHVRPAPQAGIAAVGSRSHGSAETAAWLERFQVASFVSAGSSLKLCLVAGGDADIYPRLGRTMEWDIAAGDAVLRAAGGLVTTLDGAPMLYGKRNQPGDADFANPHFVAWGDLALGQRAAGRT